MTVIDPGSSVQLIIAMLVVLFNMLLILKLAPFVDNADDWLSFTTSLQMLLTILGGLALQSDPGKFNEALMGPLLVTINSVGFLVFALSLATLHPKVRAWLNKLEEKSTNGDDAAPIKENDVIDLPSSSKVLPTNGPEEEKPAALTVNSTMAKPTEASAPMLFCTSNRTNAMAVSLDGPATGTSATSMFSDLPNGKLPPSWPLRMNVWRRAKCKIHSSQYKPRGEKTDEDIQHDGDFAAWTGLRAITPPVTASALHAFASRVQVNTTFFPRVRAVRDGLDASEIARNANVTGCTGDLRVCIACAQRMRRHRCVGRSDGAHRMGLVAKGVFCATHLSLAHANRPTVSLEAILVCAWRVTMALTRRFIAIRVWFDTNSTRTTAGHDVFPIGRLADHIEASGPRQTAQAGFILRAHLN